MDALARIGGYQAGMVTVATNTGLRHGDVIHGTHGLEDHGSRTIPRKNMSRGWMAEKTISAFRGLTDIEGTSKV
jgi:hypothetical protein